MRPSEKTGAFACFRKNTFFAVPSRSVHKHSFFVFLFSFKLVIRTPDTTSAPPIYCLADNISPKTIHAVKSPVIGINNEIGATRLAEYFAMSFPQTANPKPFAKKT